MDDNDRRGGDLTPLPDKTLFYPAWISTSGRVSLRWGKPCDQPSEAIAVGKAEVQSGNATVAFVVRFAGGERTPLPNWTYPGPARKIVKHWESLWDATDMPG